MTFKPFFSNVLVVLAICFLVALPYNCYGGQYGSLGASVSLFSDSVVIENDENSSYLNVYSLLEYSSPKYCGFSFQLSAVDGSEIWEKNDDNAEEATGSLLSQLYFQY